MALIGAIRAPLLLWACWVAIALLQLALRDQAGTVILVWLPSAVAVVALHIAPYRRWPGLLAALFAAQFTMATLSNAPLLTAIGFGMATVAEASICSGIRKRVLRGQRIPSGLHQIVGLFVAAIAGGLASALIAYPFTPAGSGHVAVWWFFATVLGILSGTPILLYVRRRLRLRGHALQLRETNFRRGFVPVTLGIFILSLVVLQISTVPLLWLVVMAMVFAIFRHGQLAAALGVWALASAGTLTSVGGKSPAAFLHFAPEMSRLVLQASMLAILALALPIGSALLNQRRLRAKLQSQNASLNESITMLNLVKTLAGVGAWQLDLASGKEQWSARMLEMHGIPPELAPGGPAIRDMLPRGAEALLEAADRHCLGHDPHSFEYTVTLASGSERILKIFLTNEWDETGKRVAVLAAGMDVTAQIRREEALERARHRAIILANKAQTLANTDDLTGLANRRRTLERLEDLLQIKTRRAGTLAVVMFDIDHFKTVNDRFGHQTGDEVLVKVAQIATEQTRAGDVIGRVGGEEFVWLLPGVDDQQARLLAERLRAAIERKSDNGELPPVTASVGIAVHRGQESTSELLARADAALYEAKESGRNQVSRAA